MKSLKLLLLLTVTLAPMLLYGQLRRVDASTLTLVGKALPTTHPYHRIDTTRYKGFTPLENQQMRCSAGLAILFKTNSTRIEVAPTYTDYIFDGISTPRIASEGFDLYIRQEGKWLYANSTVAKRRGEPFTLVADMERSEKECLLFLPIYSELTALEIGIDADATISPLENPFRHKIVLFGSSFSHGVSISRPGMSYPMQIQRNTGLGICNIALGGNCLLQSYFADYLRDIEDADAMLFDAFSNPDPEVIEERLIPFIARIRERLPHTPLIFVQTIYRERNNFNRVFRDYEARKQEAGRKMMAQAMEQFDHVYFIDADDLTGFDHETSADGTHPSDLGYWRWAQALQPRLLEILARYDIR